MQNSEISAKTANYIKTKSEETEKLLEKTIAIREKLDKSTTSFAKILYTKKLKKAVNQLDSNIRLLDAFKKLFDEHNKQMDTANNDVHDDIQSEANDSENLA